MCKCGDYQLMYNRVLNRAVRCVWLGSKCCYLASDICKALDLDPDNVVSMTASHMRDIYPMYMDGEIVDCVVVDDDGVDALCKKSSSPTTDLFRDWMKTVVWPSLHSNHDYDLSTIKQELLCLRWIVSHSDRGSIVSKGC